MRTRHRGTGSPDVVVAPDLHPRLARISRLRSPSRRVRGVLLIVATIATAVAVWFAVDALEIRLGDLRPVPLLIAAVVITPLTILLNAAELRATALASGAHIGQVGWVRSIRTVVLATAANLLPVPAGAILRVQVLRSAGASMGAAAGVQLASAGVWIGISLALAGAALIATEPLAAIAGLGAGALLVIAGLLGVRRTATARVGFAAATLSGVEFAMAVLHAVRLWVVLLGLGVTATLSQALVIGTASPLAAAAGFFPGGVGLAELLSAVLAPLAGLAAAAGLLAVAIGRLLGLAVTVPVALGLGLTDLVKHTSAGDDPLPAAEPGHANDGVTRADDRPDADGEHS